MTPQQIKNEVEKGCGKYIIGSKVLIGRDWEHDNYTCGVKRLCPSCLAKLSILTEYNESIKEMILEFEKGYKSNLKQLKNDIQGNSIPLKVCYEDFKEVTLGVIKELLSKIGEEKQDD